MYGIFAAESVSMLCGLPVQAVDASCEREHQRECMLRAGDIGSPAHPAVHPLMTKRDFLAVTDLSRDELLGLIELAGRMKSGQYRERPLAGKTLAMIFTKSSTRTRVSFEVGSTQLGGHAIFLSSRDIQLGRGEPIRDTARVLSRYVDGIMIRTFAHADVEELARYSTVPVINGLTDYSIPARSSPTCSRCTRTWATCRSASSPGSATATTWRTAGSRPPAVLGFELRLACPEGYDPDPALVAAAGKRTRIVLTRSPDEAVRGADVVNTDVWASMGQEAEQEAARDGIRRVPRRRAAHALAPTSRRSFCTASRRTGAKK